MQEITDLRQELQSKEALLAKHQDRIQRWRNMMTVPQNPQQHQPTPQQAPASTSQAGAGAAQSQGHLAYLEQTTSNIGVNGRKS